MVEVSGECLGKKDTCLCDINSYGTNKFSCIAIDMFFYRSSILQNENSSQIYWSFGNVRCLHYSRRLVTWLVMELQRCWNELCPLKVPIQTSRITRVTRPLILRLKLVSNQPFVLEKMKKELENVKRGSFWSL